jgi:1,2-diacylglycerol 3-beta-galactosyltransferase
MADWLRCADAVVTKAGPGTIAETLCCGTPLLLTSYLSGQEKGNAEFVVNAGAGRWVPQLPQLLDAVRELRDDPVLLGQMRVNAASVGRPDAAAAVARLIADMATPRLGSFAPTAEMAMNHVPFRMRIRKRAVSGRLREPAVR